MHPRDTFLLSSLPGWFAAGVLAWGAVRWLDLNAGIAAALVVLWIIIDVARYPAVKHFYRSEPAWARMRGEQGIALTPLDPCGVVQVHGEIWQARASMRHHVPEGARVRVREVQGLVLVVELE